MPPESPSRDPEAEEDRIFFLTLVNSVALSHLLFVWLRVDTWVNSAGGFSAAVALFTQVQWDITWTMSEKAEILNVISGLQIQDI